MSIDGNGDLLAGLGFVWANKDIINAVGARSCVTMSSVSQLDLGRGNRVPQGQKLR